MLEGWKGGFMLWHFWFSWTWQDYSVVLKENMSSSVANFIFMDLCQGNFEAV